jgi:hypothetical protein
MGDPAIRPCNLMSAPTPPGTRRTRSWPSPSKWAPGNSRGSCFRERAEDPGEQPEIHQAPCAVPGLVTDKPVDEPGQLHGPGFREEGLAGQLRYPPLVLQLVELRLRP